MERLSAVVRGVKMFPQIGDEGKGTNREMLEGKARAGL